MLEVLAFSSPPSTTTLTFEMPGQPIRSLHKTDSQFFRDQTDAIQHYTDVQDLISLHQKSGLQRPGAGIRPSWDYIWSCPPVNGDGEASYTIHMTWSRNIQFEANSGGLTAEWDPGFFRESRVSYNFGKHFASRIADECAKYSEPLPNDPTVMGSIALRWWGKAYESLLDWEQTADQMDVNSMEVWHANQRTFDLKQQNPDATFSTMTFKLGG